MRKILFVDDEPKVLQGLKRMLYSRRGKWHMEFVDSGTKALERLKQEHFQVVVSDMRMPGMDGAELLEQVRKLSPCTVRLILSGHSECDGVLRTVRPAHQYLAKPVERECLEQVIQNALDLQEMLAQASLTDLLSQMESLPALPSMFVALLDEIESEGCSLNKVGELISRDMGMTATMLKLVNSAFFGLPRKVSNPAQAVALLGMDTIKALVLSYQLFSQLGQKKLKIFSLEALWGHSLNTAGFAKAIAQHENWSRDQADKAFLTGMLHDVGKLTLITVADQVYEEVVTRVRRGQGPLHELEKAVLGTTHAAVGAYLLGLWGFEMSIIHAIGSHHSLPPPATQGLDMPALVHVANALEHELVVIHPDYQRQKVDMDYLEAVGEADHVGVWREVCQDIMKRGGANAWGDPS